MATDYLVRDDFVSPAEAEDLELLLFGPYFPWYYLDNTTTRKGARRWSEVECAMHVHNLYFKGSANNPGYQQILERFRLPHETLIRMKANMVMARPFEFRPTPFHVDRLDPHYTVVYYVNDSTGATVLRSRDGRRTVEPRRGRIVIFDGSVMHAHYLPWWQPRCVINFNFSAWPLPGPPAFPATPVDTAARLNGT